MQSSKRFSLFWFDPNPTKGAEIQKIRPCIVVSPEIMNDVVDTVIIVPITSTIKNWPFRLTTNILGKKSSIACDQLRSIDKSRLIDYIGVLNTNDSKQILKVTRTIFAF